MGYAISGHPDYRTGLPSLFDPGPNFQNQSYINWDGPYFNGLPTYGHFGGPGLTPGMAVTVEIKTGTRRIIEYVMSPLLRYRLESLRER